MVTEGPVKMASAGDDLEVDIDALLREHQHQHQHQHQQQPLRELGVPRSGSAPPTVEGSMAALRSMLGAIDIDVGREEGDVRADPAYLAYYYSNENTNPRLPPPVLSREDWRATQRLRSFGGIGDQRKKAVAVAPGASAIVSEEEGQEAFDHGLQTRRESPVANWGNDGLTGLPGMGLGPMGARKKSFADVLQKDLARSTAAIGHSSPPVSRNPFNGTLDPVGMLDCQLIKPQTAIESAGHHSSLASTGLNGVHSIGSSLSPPLSSGRNATLFRSRTPDPKLIQRIPSPGLPPISTRSTLSSDIPSGLIDHGDIAATFSGIDLSNTRYSSAEVCGDELAESNDFLVNLPHEQNHYLQQNINNPEMQPINIHCLPMEAYNDLFKKKVFFDSNAPKLSSNGHAKLQRNLSSGGISSKISTLGSIGVEGSGRSFNKTELSNPTFAGSNLVGFLPNQASQERLPNHLSSGNGLEGQYLNRSVSQDGSRLQSPLYAQYLQRANLAAQASSILNEPLAGRNLAESSLMDINGYQKAYFEALAAQQKLQHGLPFLGNSISLDRSSYVSSAYGLGLPYSSGHASSSLLSTLSTGNSLRQPERLSRFPSTGRTSTGGNLGSWMPENGIKEVGLSSSFLEEFKTSKTKNYELSDILNHVVEFSADQYGSRFIQQKLESAPVDEKNLIFPEILPHARALMTDVFGNYVIQKFFEHGTETQRMQLASQLKGHVLPLSLQMYGCRVIQKALEVVDVDQQTEMVSELDGSVMKCVRDQNGNHVIQKCIECVPQEKVQFIISTFYGQVVTLSMHPYGCRVIQRVLENCNDSKTLNIMMDEILKSVSSLAQDQYGNYVVQHVLQHGKPEERSAIISTLAGQIVKMSQQKFASNVVEKCLTYGTVEERQILINEMLGATDENEPLQAMMKDQFGNYVVQKVLETCDDQNREFILSRIKVHLNALKRYTYGKHIVARVEKLVAAGERHVATMSPCS